MAATTPITPIVIKTSARVNAYFLDGLLFFTKLNGINRLIVLKSGYPPPEMSV